MTTVNENTVEAAGLPWFGKLGYQTINGEQIALGEPGTERISYSDVLLVGRLRDAIHRLNPEITNPHVRKLCGRWAAGKHESLCSEPSMCAPEWDGETREGRQKALKQELLGVVGHGTRQSVGWREEAWQKVVRILAGWNGLICGRHG